MLIKKLGYARFAEELKSRIGDVSESVTKKYYLENIDRPVRVVLDEIIMTRGLPSPSYQMRKQQKTAIQTVNNQIFLLDISGSMGGRLDYHKRKIDVLREVMRQFPMHQLQIYAFSRRCKLIRNGIIPNPQSTTNLTDALRVTLPKAERLLLISDGLPDNPDRSMSVATRHNIPIDVIFIGNEDEGRWFMERIAKVTNGKVLSVSTASATIMAQQLTQNINKLLLPPPKK